MSQEISTLGVQRKFNLKTSRRFVENLMAGEAVDDSLFDSLLTRLSRASTKRHWTPVAIARRAAQLLTQEKHCNVLDVGSGTGKFCIVGALTTPAYFVGVERRKALASEARELIRALEVPRIDFLCRDMRQLDWGGYDAVYLYNPFQENIDTSAQIDDDFEMTEEHHGTFVKITQQKLARMKKGTRVVTYHGFGGPFPGGYEKKLTESWGDDFLELWIKN